MVFYGFLKKHPIAKVILFIAVILLIYSAQSIYVWTQTQSTDNAYVEADISSVSSEINGIICEVLVKENNYVKAGQIIARVDNKDYLAHYEKACAEWEGASHEIGIIEQDIALAQIDQTKALEAFEFAEANLKINRTDYARIKELSKGNFASKKRLDDTEITFEKAKTEYSEAKLNMQTVAGKLALLEIKKLAAIAKLKTMTQQKALAHRALSNTEIRSPIDGALGNSSLKIGNYIRAGTVLFVVVPMDSLYVKANFKETQISKFKAGMKAHLEFDSVPDKITGTIRNISPATGAKFSLLPPANATGNFTKIVQRVPVLIDFTVPESLKEKIVPGMSTIVKVRIDNIT